MNINYKSNQMKTIMSFTAACSSTAIATCATVTTQAESITEQINVTPTCYSCWNI